jgi:hypothetical protein
MGNHRKPVSRNAKSADGLFDAQADIQNNKVTI